MPGPSHPSLMPLVAALAAATAHADVQTFTSSFEFFNALDDAAHVTEDFEGFGLDEVIPPGTQVGNVIYDSFPTAFGGLVGDNYFNLGFQSLYLERDGVAGHGETDFYYPGESIAVAFAQDVYAIGIFFNVDISEFSDYMYIETPVGTASTGGALQDLNGMFFAGLISDQPFGTAVIGSTADAPTGWNMDELTYAVGGFMTWNVTLSGCQEVPEVTTTGNGTASVTLDTLNNTITVEGTYQDMEGIVTAAHIHGPAQQGQNAGVILTLNTTGGTSGDITGNGTLTPENVQNVLDGLTYINVHSETYPGGEIRAQIVVHCPGDFNGDGVKNILDFVEFQGAFVGGACLADVNHDKIYNILDFVAFQTLFQQACE